MQLEIATSTSNTHQLESKSDRMDDNNLSDALLKLAKGKNRPATARIREIFNEIEAALNAGVRRKDVHQALAANGFEGLSFEGFELAIYRIRKERNVQKKNTAKPFALASRANSEETNPMRALSGQPKDGDFNPIPTAKFEVDHT